MRHEAKLSFIRKASRRGNFKNICLTVVKHHQLWLSYSTCCIPHLIYPALEHSPKKSETLLRDEPEYVQSIILRSVTNSAECTVVRPDWVKYQTTTYRHGSFVLFCRHEMTPVFGKIVDIVITRHTDDIFLNLELFSSLLFSNHYNAFVIDSSYTTSFVNVKSLPDYYVLMPRSNFDATDKSTYLTLPYIF